MSRAARPKGERRIQQFLPPGIDPTAVNTGKQYAGKGKMRSAGDTHELAALRPCSDRLQSR
jgi:hypothetical protein